MLRVRSIRADHPETEGEMKTKDVNGVRLYPTEEEEQTVVMHWAAMVAGRWPELRL